MGLDRFVEWVFGYFLVGQKMVVGRVVACWRHGSRGVDAHVPDLAMRGGFWSRKGNANMIRSGQSKRVEGAYGWFKVLHCVRRGAEGY